MGGKFRIAHKLASYLNKYKPRVYLEPFCGSCKVGLLVDAEVRIFSDSNPYLIAMWKALMDGWLPPKAISEKEYKAFRLGAGEDHERGFAGIVCSFSGGWFRGYARGGHQDYVGEGRRTLLRCVNKMRGTDVRFMHCDYATALKEKADLIYCDPPYAGTAQNYYETKFDVKLFWKTIRGLPEDKRVFVSEYAAHKGFEEVMSIRTKTDIRMKHGNDERIEKLYGRVGSGQIGIANPAFRDLWKGANQ
jgi:DNA adenine methylase